MSKFFFYDNFKNTQLIDLISLNYTICDGYIYIKNFDNNIIDINGTNKQLFGKIVYFDLEVYQILEKINKIQNINTNHKYLIKKIDVNKSNDSIESAYIIY
jgi:hypothetical protein